MTVTDPQQAAKWLENLKALIQLGYPGLVTIAIVVTFSLYVRTTNERIQVLENRLTACEQRSGLR